MARINPLPRQRLADPELADLLARQIAAEEGAKALAEEAEADLHRLIGAADRGQSGAALQVRRDIHNDRRPANVDGLDGLPASVGRWLDNHQSRQAGADRVADTYDAALARERAAVRHLLADPNFRTTLATTAPLVYDAACRYQSRADVDARDRKSERGVVQYLTRAMVRTSPYGRFTAVGLAELGDTGVPLDQVTPASASPQVEMDQALFNYVMGGLVAAGDDPLVTLAPTLQTHGDRVTFFHIGPAGLKQLAAPLTAKTRLLMELVGLGPRPLSAIAGDLAQRLPAERDEARRMVAGALRLGLVTTAWQADELVAEPLPTALQALPDHDGLRQLHDGLQRLGSSGPGERRVLLHQLTGIGDQLSQAARRPARLTVNEDFALDPLVVDPRSSEAALDDLAGVTEFLAAFDRMHVVRGLLVAACVERFGPGCRVKLVEHAEALVQAVYRREARLGAHPDAESGWSRGGVGPADGSLAVLRKVRQEALLALQHSLAAGGEEVAWSPDDLRDLVAGLPDRFVTDPASYGVVVQPDGGDLIVNDAYAGHGPMVSRFLDADRRRGGTATARLRSRIHHLYGADARLLEDRALHGMGINAHPPVLDDALDAERWLGLRLVHDAELDRLSIVDDDGTPVRVLGLGAELPELFPYPLRLATWLGSTGRLVVDVTAHRRKAGQETVHYPRLRVGKVILSRRRWYPGPDFPPREAAVDDVDFLLALTRWRGGHGVPAEVMLKSQFDGPVRWDSLADPASRDRFFELRRQAKPQYVDLASAVMARVLPRLLDRRPAGYLEEARPAMAGGGHALEWMIEMCRPIGASRFGWRPGA